MIGLCKYMIDFKNQGAPHIFEKNSSRIPVLKKNFRMGLESGLEQLSISMHQNYHFGTRKVEKRELSGVLSNLL